jgi:hypothetical protein
MKKHAAIVAAVVALCAPSVASATNWEHYGWLPSGYDAQCLWYPTYGQCSGWNYWVLNDGHVYTGGPALTGFENYATIRGRWTYAGQYAYTHPLDFGMPSYVKAQMTNYSGIPAWVESWAGA